MVKSLFIIGILSFLSAVVYSLTKKYNSKLLAVSIIFAGGYLFGYLVPFSASNVELLDKIIRNLLPPMLFLFALDLDIKRVFKNEIGCSCKMGAKRYALLISLAIFVTIFSQVVGYYFFKENVLLISSFIGFVLGYIASFTRLRFINGSEDIATTMLYLLSGVVGMRLF
jgi:uncharacterized membrane protein